MFLHSEHYQQYLLWLGEYAQREQVSVWAYCLMPNHVHLVLVPQNQLGLARLLRSLHSHYAQSINKQEQAAGHLWGQRYYSTVLDERHLLTAVRYVERNPVRAALVSHAEDYAWSSAPCRCGQRADPLLSSDMPLTHYISDWSDWLRTEDEDDVADLRVRTARGIPSGDHQFVKNARLVARLDTCE